MRKILVIFSFILVSFSSYSQRIVKGINPLRGRAVDFVFRSMSDIKGGKSLGDLATAYTEIYVYFDTTDGFVPANVKGWELIAYSNASTLEADFGSPNLDLTKVNIYTQITSAAMSGSAVAVSPLSSDANNVIASGPVRGGANTDVEWTVSIYYECAMPGGLMNVDSDYYFTDFILYIKETY